MKNKIEYVTPIHSFSVDIKPSNDVLQRVREIEREISQLQELMHAEDVIRRSKYRRFGDV